jgi:hypothetical protein
MLLNGRSLGRHAHQRDIYVSFWHDAYQTVRVSVLVKYLFHDFRA